MLFDTIFSDAGWVFFAIWSVAVLTISVAAFGPDLFRSEAATAASRTHPCPAISKNDAQRV